MEKLNYPELVQAILKNYKTISEIAPIVKVKGAQVSYFAPLFN